MKYGRFTLGQIEAILNKLGGEAKLRGILSGAFKVNLLPVEPWRTVRMGTYSNAAELREALIRNREVLTEGPHNSLSAVNYPDMVLVQMVTLKKLVVVKPEQLGLSDLIINSKQLQEAAAEHGLQFCPDETAVELLAHGGLTLQQLRDEGGHLIFASESILQQGVATIVDDFQGWIRIFLWEDNNWSALAKYVFVRA